MKKIGIIVEPTVALQDGFDALVDGALLIVALALSEGVIVGRQELVGSGRLDDVNPGLVTLPQGGREG